MSHVIIVEDNADIQSLYRWMVQRALNTDPIMLSDGEAALEYLKSHVPDLMILDVNLPGHSGLDVLKYARLKLGLTSERMKVVLSTANGVVKYSPQIKMADCFLEKPIQPRQFMDSLQKLMNELQVKS